MVLFFAGSAACFLLAESAIAQKLQESHEEGRIQSLRGSFISSKKNVIFDSSDPFADIDRSGIDRSLSSIHVESELNLMDQEHYDKLVNIISKFSEDGNDDGTLTCPFDYEGDVDPFHPKSNDDGRILMEVMGGGGGVGHMGMNYVESSCNSMLGMATCVNWSEWIATAYPTFGATTYPEEIKIPCGECVIMDASVGQDLEGQTLNFDQGLNIVGKLLIPNDADITFITKYVFVQGELSMPAPTNPNHDLTNGPKVKFTLYGTEDLMFHADELTDNAHLMGKGVSAKPFVVAGGKIDIRAIDSRCPAWVKLQSIQYGTPLLNIALGKPATQIDTYRHMPAATADAALDGNQTSFTHTECSNFEPWWQVDLEAAYTISSIRVVNRLDCCGGRLHDFYIRFYDESMTEVDTIFNAGGIGNVKTFNTDYIQARFVKIHLSDTDCLQLGEVEIFGWLASEATPTSFFDVLTVGEDAARCWSSPGSRILLTSDTYDWDDSQIVEVAESTPSIPGAIAVHPLPKKKTAADETFGYPDFAVEVALIDRSLIIEGAPEDPNGEFATLGGHFIVLHTPNVHQHLEGALLQNMGQAGRLGRYPLHFHMSESVGGSTLKKNVILKSNQRCAVVHGTHNVTISNNVAFDTKGHCFMLEDGGEFDNTFEYNLGAKTGSLPLGQPQAGETDNRPATFWITNPSNYFVGNVAAGSVGTGFWFELKLRGPSAELPIAQGISPKNLPLGSFIDNTAHSNNLRAGITTYETGYQAPPGTTWINTKSYKNRESGLFQHGTTNIYLQGGLLADNQMAAHNFHHDWAVYDDVDVIGRSQHAQSMIDQGRLPKDCNRAGGISIQPNEGLGRGTTIKNSRFSGFDNDCNSGRNRAIFVSNEQVRNGVFDSRPIIQGNTFDSPMNKRISACNAIHNSPDADFVRYVAVEDIDGSLSGIGPGFFVQDEPAITSFIDTTSCQDLEDSCLLFCPGACLRIGIISISQDLTTRGFQMHIADAGGSANVARGPIWFDELQNHLSAQMPIVLPEPSTISAYQVTFTDKNNEAAWPGYASLTLENAPACTGGLSDASQVDFIMPDASIPGRCDNLFKYDDYANGLHGWQNFFAGLSVTEVEGKYVISTTRRKSDGGHVNLSRTLDASCIALNGGKAFTIYGKIRTKDAQGNDVATDGLSIASPKISFIVKAGNSDLFRESWFQATKSDGTWTEFKRKMFLPTHTSSATKAQIIIDQAEKKEFLITEWGVVMSDPTDAPSKMPTSSPSGAPSLSPSTSAAPFVKNAPVTAAPVPAIPSNLALNGLASANSECWGGYAYKAVDGDDSSINHSCCDLNGWLMVDLGKDTLNYIDKIVIRNRKDCCGGRTREFHVEVLNANKTVVYKTYYPGTLGNGAVGTFAINNGTAGRFVRVRFNETRQDCLHIAELEVWGYPIKQPAVKPNIIEMAQGKVASASSIFTSNTPAWKSNDGDVNTIHHSSCKDNPWWTVDLGSVSFIQDVVITNRKDCCGGRLRSATVAILDKNQNVVESRMIVGSIGNGDVVQKVFNEDTSIGRYVKVSMDRVDCLHMAEVAVHGYHLSI